MAVPTIVPATRQNSLSGANVPDRGSVTTVGLARKTERGREAVFPLATVAEANFEAVSNILVPLVPQD
jgi:hypothetical protein